MSKTGTASQGLAPILPQVLGLRLKLGLCGDPSAAFVPAPQPAQPSESFHSPSSTCVVRFSRPIAFEAVDQAIEISPVRIAIAADAIRGLGLDGTILDGSASTAELVQTQLAYDSNLSLDPRKVGLWAVTVQGVPGQG